MSLVSLLPSHTPSLALFYFFLPLLLVLSLSLVFSAHLFTPSLPLLLTLPSLLPMCSYHLSLLPPLLSCVAILCSLAAEFMDDVCMKMVEKHLSLRNPLSPHPFYALVETSGSHDEHDKEVGCSMVSAKCECVCTHVWCVHVMCMHVFHVWLRFSSTSAEAEWFSGSCDVQWSDRRWDCGS